MKLRNKKTDEIIDFNSITDVCFGSKIQLQSTERYNKPIYIYNSLAELNAEWEDYKEPDEIWYINWKGDVYSADIDNPWEDEKQIGNYFSTKEEAEKVVEKLKAWKRLKDKGFKFTGWDRHPDFDGDFRITASDDWNCDDKDLNLLFGGE